MKAVKIDLAKAINEVRALLKRDYGCDYSFNICANGQTVAQSNVHGEQGPIAIIGSSHGKPLVSDYQKQTGMSQNEIDALHRQDICPMD